MTYVICRQEVSFIPVVSLTTRKFLYVIWVIWSAVIKRNRFLYGMNSYEESSMNKCMSILSLSRTLFFFFDKYSPTLTRMHRPTHPHPPHPFNVYFLSVCWVMDSNRQVISLWFIDCCARMNRCYSWFRKLDGQIQYFFFW